MFWQLSQRVAPLLSSPSHEKAQLLAMESGSGSTSSLELRPIDTLTNATATSAAAVASTPTPAPHADSHRNAAYALAGPSLDKTVESPLSESEMAPKVQSPKSPRNAVAPAPSASESRLPSQKEAFNTKMLDRDQEHLTAGVRARLLDRLKHRHTWMAVYFREAESPYTTVERMTVLLTLLMAMVLANAVVYNNTGADYSFGDMVLVGLVISVIVVPIPRAVALLLRRSRLPECSHAMLMSVRRFLYPNKIEKRLQSSIGRLRLKSFPHGCSYVGMVLGVVFSMACTYLAILYGVEFGENAAHGWLVSTGVSVLQSVLINEPLSIAITVLLSSVLGGIFSLPSHYLM
eukprot:GCRY01003008.1.p1 GENE.GCRY01003008.1~~GCRY01003008.1.p1  ORF type:complete len:347 (+),score=99.86 GCRY01003008.1:57-1097(+)